MWWQHRGELRFKLQTYRLQIVWMLSLVVPNRDTQGARFSWTDGSFVDLQCTCCSILHVSMGEPKRAWPNCGSRPAIAKLGYAGVTPTHADPLQFLSFFLNHFQRRPSGPSRRSSRSKRPRGPLNRLLNFVGVLLHPPDSHHSQESTIHYNKFEGCNGLCCVSSWDSTIAR